jgi:hypothetical protein
MQENHTRDIRKGVIRLVAAAMATLLLAIGAHAAVIAVAQQGKQRLELHDQAGHCLGEARLAIFSDGAQRIPGCWLARAEHVTVAFLDGDHVAVPFALFRRPQEL